MRGQQDYRNYMAFAKGRSCVVAELDILREALENMINSIENRFQNNLDFLKARIFDIEHDQSIPYEEKDSQLRSLYDEIEKHTCQLHHSRNKLVICIYSICEATLASICADYKINVKHEDQHNKKKDFYLTDYLFSIDNDYLEKLADAHIVSLPLRELRNHLTHSSSTKNIFKHIADLNNNGFNDITLFGDQVIIRSKDFLTSILNCCYNLLNDAETIAKQKFFSERMSSENDTTNK